MEDLMLILGPMKSGKSFELIARFAPLQYSDISHSVGMYQSVRNIRDEKIRSRNGVHLAAKKIHSLNELLDTHYTIIGIDEIHMFAESDVEAVRTLLRRGVKIIASGLDTDYTGTMFPVIRRLLELGPSEVQYKRAVCEECRDFTATHTQILCNEEPILENLPPIVPDDGTYEYRSTCRRCFVQKQQTPLT